MRLITKYIVYFSDTKQCLSLNTDKKQESACLRISEVNKVSLSSSLNKTAPKPNEHDPIILSDTGPRKHRSEPPVFIRLFQRTRSEFLSQTRNWTYITIFIGVSFGAHSPIFLSKLLRCNYQESYDKPQS